MATGTSPARAQAPETSEQLPIDSLPLEEQIRQRAHQIWLENGCPAGSELLDWIEAEKDILEGQR
jgi:DUF2934 family protein